MVNPPGLELLLCYAQIIKELWRLLLLHSHGTHIELLPILYDFKVKLNSHWFIPDDPTSTQSVSQVPKPLWQ